MATSGSFQTTNGYTTSGGYKYNLEFLWERTSYSIENNTSTIKWTVRGVSTSSGTYVKAQNLILKIDGVEIWNHSVDDGQFNMYNGTVLGTGSYTIKHNTDGTKSFSAYVEGGLYIWSPPNATGTKSFTLDTIPRASTLSATNVNIGSQTTITVTKATSSFTHTITYKFGSLTGTIATKSASASIKWTVPTTFYAQIPNAKSGTCTLTCTTYNGSTSLGSKTATFTCTAAESLCKPLLAPVVEDINETTIALTGDSSKLIKYYSKANTQVVATARNSATIKSESTKYNGTTYSQGQCTFNEVESNSFTFSATDSRGYTTSETKTVSMVNYIKLTCNLDCDMPTTDGVMPMKISGNCFNGSFGAVSNVIDVEFRFKEDGAAEWSEWQLLGATKNNNTYTAQTTINGLDYQKTYVFEARVTDKLSNKYSAQIKVNTLPVFDWGEDDFNFNVPIYMNGVQTLRTNDEKKLVLSAENDIYLRPKGNGIDEAQLRLTADGRMIHNGYTIPYIDVGSAKISYGTTTQTLNVNFNITYAAKPVVMIEQVFDDTNIRVSSVSTTGFTASVAGAFTSSGSRSFNWCAIGTKA